MSGDATVPGTTAVPLTRARDKVTFVAGFGIVTLVGAALLVGQLTGASSTGGAARTAGIVLAGIFALIGVLGLALSPFVVADRSVLHASAEGLTCTGTSGKDWSVRWNELAQVRVGVLHWRAGRSRREGYKVCVDLFPIEDGFAGRHPSLADCRGAWGIGPGAYRVPVANGGWLAEPLDRALRTSAGPRSAQLLDQPLPRAPRR